MLNSQHDAAGETTLRTQVEISHNDGVTLVFAFIAALVILAAALAFTGRWSVGIIGTDRPPASRHPAAGEWSAENIDSVEFRVALRGYRMEDVDAVLASLARQLSDAESRAPSAPQVKDLPHDASAP